MKTPNGIYTKIVNLSYLVDVADSFPQTFNKPIIGWPMKPYTDGKNILLLTFPRSNSTITHKIFAKHYLGNSWDGIMSLCKIRIMLVRNQFDRILSAFYRGPHKCLDFFHDDTDFSNLTFKQFVLRCLPAVLDHMIQNFQDPMDSKAYHIAPYWLSLFAGNFKYLLNNHIDLLNEGFQYVTTDQYELLLQVLKLRGFDIDPTIAKTRLPNTRMVHLKYSKTGMIEPYNMKWKDLDMMDRKPNSSEMYSKEMEEFFHVLYMRDMYLFDKSILELKKEAE